MTSSADLCYLTAHEALQLFRRRALSPVELVQAHIEQIGRYDGPLNAIRAHRFETALEQARAAEQLYARAPDTAGMLEGIPTLLKNEHNLIGEETDIGSLLLAGTRDTANSPIVDRLLGAGVIFHARTHVPEFCIAAFTRTLAHGVTRNPWNPAITCGGSSGGSAAGLAAGMGTLATGSDIGGSIRTPAAYCGVVGLKASYGRIPEGNYGFAMNTFNHNGFLTRSIADATLMFNVMNGPHPRDPSMVRPKLTLAIPDGDIRGLRVALSVDLGYFDVDPEIEDNTRRAADMLRERGAIVEEVALDWNAGVAGVFIDGLGFVLGRTLGAMLADAPRDAISDYVLHTVETGLGITPEQYLDSYTRAQPFHDALQQVFERYDVLLCPTLAQHRTPAEGVVDATRDAVENTMTYPFNVFSRHPVLAVPSGLSRSGVPTSVQIVGRTFCDDTVLNVGAALEAQVGWRAWRPKMAASDLNL